MSSGKFGVHLDTPSVRWDDANWENRLEVAVYEEKVIAMLRDAFISHASEDKIGFVKEFADALLKKGSPIWYDEYELRAGESLREAIDRGLSLTRYGIVVLSPAFFAKKWPRLELDGLFDEEANKERGHIIPIWHNVDHTEVSKFSRILAGRVGLLSRNGLNAMVQKERF